MKLSEIVALLQNNFIGVHEFNECTEKDKVARVLAEQLHYETDTDDEADE